MLLSGLVDAVRALVFVASQACGHSTGGGILVISFAARIALLPLTLRIARRMREHQLRITTLAPEMEKLRERHGEDRAGLAAATMTLYRRHDIGVLPKGMLAAMLIQMPLGATLYRAFASGFGPRTAFLWIGDLARPDAVLAVVAGVVAGIAVGVTPSATKGVVIVNMAVTAYLAWRLTASVGLYWVASNSVSAAQAIVLRRSTSDGRSRTE